MSNTIYNKEYVKWLEEALQELVNLPVKGIYIHAVLDGGAIYTNPYNINMMDKIAIAGLVQQDAMFEAMKNQRNDEEDT